MKKQSLSMLLAALMVTNSVPMAAMAQSRVDDALIDQSIAAQSNEMKRTLQQIDALISSMEKYKSASQSEKQNAFVNAARLMITLLGLGSTMVHVKNTQAESSIELTLAAISGVLSTALEKYVSSQQINMDDVKKLIEDQQSNLKNALGEADARDADLIAGAVSQLSTINSELDSKMGDIKRQIDNGQVDMAIISITTLVLHYATPFLPQKMRAAVSDKAPNLVNKLATTKKRSMQGLGATNIATLLSTIAGLGGASSQAQLDKILANLYATKANLMKQGGIKNP